MAVTYQKKIYPATYKRTYIAPIKHKDTQGPCPNGFHIGTRTEWANVGTIFSNLGLSDKTNFMNYFKAPSTYYLNRSTATKNTSYGPVRFWASTMEQKSSARCMYINEKSELNFGAVDKPSNGFSIRPFKDYPVVPDLNDGWVQTFDGSSVASGAGIYRNSTLGLISMSSNGDKWITASDKNLGATNVGDNGLYYQFGNNYGFTETPSSTYTSTQDATGYGPGNYYNNEHFVKVSSNNWMTSDNNNIWGGKTNGYWYS